MKKIIPVILLAAAAGCSPNYSAVPVISPISSSSDLAAIGAAQERCFAAGNQPGSDEMASCVGQRLSENPSAQAIASGQVPFSATVARATVYQTPSYSTPRPITYRRYIRGPRGGCYYINSNGNKTYVDRSLCN